MTCEHCAPILEHLAASNATLGRPVDSADSDNYGAPRGLVRQSYGDCPCSCHAIHRMTHRRPL